MDTGRQSAQLPTSDEDTTLKEHTETEGQSQLTTGHSCEILFVFRHNNMAIIFIYHPTGE